ncbi:MAG: universal stress protein, partial [Rhodospirillales bacterium]|nr:universal stress protein [Rhodospirillales bacterium]
MTIKDILVHMDSGERAAIRLDLAITLARRFDARVFGLFAQVERSAPSLVARKASDALRAAGARAETMFLEKTEAAGVRAKWQALAQGEYSFVIRETIICARFADLVILGQHDREHDGTLVPDELPEQVILHSGRPVLMVPYAGEFTDAGRRVMVAWNAGRESARAV